MSGLQQCVKFVFGAVFALTEWPRIRRNRSPDLGAGGLRRDRGRAHLATSRHSLQLSAKTKNEHLVTARLPIGVASHAFAGYWLARRR